MMRGLTDNSINRPDGNKSYFIAEGLRAGNLFEISRRARENLVIS